MKRKYPVLNEKEPRFKREKICAALRQLIVDEKLNAGDKLGAERELAIKLNVQRLTVRRAIKQLCSEGVLKQRPNRGTFVQNVPKCLSDDSENDAGQNAEGLFAPTSHIFTSSPVTTIHFISDESLPEQIACWQRIIKRFSELYPNIRVKHHYKNVKRCRADEYDCALVLPLDLHSNLRLGSDLVFPQKWFQVNPYESLLPEEVVKRINSYASGDDGYKAIPILTTFSIQAVNKDLCDQLHLSLPPSGESLLQAKQWLDNLNVPQGIGSSNFYTHSPLSHLCRLDESVVNSQKVDLGSECCRELLQTMKLCWERSSPFFAKGTGLVDLIESFAKGQTLSIETFIHFIPIIKQYFKGNMQFAFNSSVSGGLIQVLPRYIMLGGNREKYYETIEFCQFLASPEGQGMIADEGLGIPYYDGVKGAEYFSQKYQVNLDELKQEYTNTKAFYESIFFKYDLQDRIINPTIKGYLTGALSLDQLVDSIRFRTEQQYKLFTS